MAAENRHSGTLHGEWGLGPTRGGGHSVRGKICIYKFWRDKSVPFLSEANILCMMPNNCC